MDGAEPLVGLDLVEVERFRRAVERRPGIRNRVLTEHERRHCEARSDPVPCMAARFAAKEAVGKLMGTGVLSWQEIQIDAGPPPAVRLSGRTAQRAHDQGIRRIGISLTHTRATAGAVATALREKGEVR